MKHLFVHTLVGREDSIWKWILDIGERQRLNLEVAYKQTISLEDDKLKAHESSH